MRRNFLVLLSCLLLLPPFGHASGKTIYGLSEQVALPELGFHLPAKLDTGAQTASLSARDIQHFRRGDERWVRFVLAWEGEADHVIERPLARISKIKRRAGDFDPDEEKSYTPRPVVALEMCLGSTRRRVEVNLTDRSAFKYPLLIGADALADLGALVDPSLTIASIAPDCTDPAADE